MNQLLLIRLLVNLFMKLRLC